MPEVSPLTVQHLLKFKMFGKGQTESTCVANVDYDPETEELTVEFIKRGTYKYSGVPLDEYVDFSLADSQGKYFNFYIRDKYSFERVA